MATVGSAGAVATGGSTTGGSVVCSGVVEPPFDDAVQPANTEDRKTIVKKQISFFI